MARLNDEMKEFIVKRLACFYTPTQVAEAVKVRFGVRVTRQQVHGYDPESVQPPGAHWVRLHAEVRAQFLVERAETEAPPPSDVLALLDRPGPGSSPDVLQQQAARFLERIDREAPILHEDFW